MKSPFMLRSTHDAEVARVQNNYEDQYIELAGAYNESLMAAQVKVDEEYQRAVTLCRGQLRAWARDATYNIFMESTFDMRTGGALRALFSAATSVLSPSKLVLAEQEAIAKASAPQPKTLSEGLYGGTGRD
jgi:hypothetical protein